MARKQLEGTNCKRGGADLSTNGSFNGVVQLPRGKKIWGGQFVDQDEKEAAVGNKLAGKKTGIGGENRQRRVS